MEMQQHMHDRESRTRTVVLITGVAMIVEVTSGIATNSVSLLAEGIHLGSHVLAVGLSWAAYVVARTRNARDSQRTLSIAACVSGLLLLVFACEVAREAAERLAHPREVHYARAIATATLGLLLQGTCVWILHFKHHQSDQNFRAAYFHVLADTISGVAAVAGLSLASIFRLPWLDAAVAFLCSGIISLWAIKLLARTSANMFARQPTGSR